MQPLKIHDQRTHRPWLEVKLALQKNTSGDCFKDYYSWEEVLPKMVNSPVANRRVSQLLAFSDVEQLHVSRNTFARKRQIYVPSGYCTQF
ncbi:unnamed protein product [Caretta caretta]